ncbi:MAG: hypothetical protein ACM3WV_11480 [Bacillota bacterium]
MDIGQNIQTIVNIYQKNFGLLVGATFVACLLSFITFGILAGPLIGGLIVLCLKLHKGEKGEFTEIFAHMSSFLPALSLTIGLWAGMIAAKIIGFVPVVGRPLFAVCSSVLGIIYVFSIIYVVDKGEKPQDAVKKGSALFLADPLRVWLYILIVAILGGIGIILLLPVICTMPIAVVGTALAYQDLSAMGGASKVPEQYRQIAGYIVAALIVTGLICMFTINSRSVFSGRLGAPSGKKKYDIGAGRKNPGNKLPGSFPRDIPIYKGAEVESFTGVIKNKEAGAAVSTVILVTRDKAEAVEKFYTQKLQANAWEVSATRFGAVILLGKKLNRECTVTIAPQKGKIRITLVESRKQ